MIKKIFVILMFLSSLPQLGSARYFDNASHDLWARYFNIGRWARVPTQEITVVIHVRDRIIPNTKILITTQPDGSTRKTNWGPFDVPTSGLVVQPVIVPNSKGTITIQMTSEQFGPRGNSVEVDYGPGQGLVDIVFDVVND